MKMLIIGNTGGTHIGESMMLAAESLYIQSEIIQPSIGIHKSRIINRTRKYFFDNVPANQGRFEAVIRDKINRFRPDFILFTGCVYISDRLFEEIKHNNIVSSVFLTDDPWNKNSMSRSFVRSLHHYDYVFNPRLLNMDDVKELNVNTFYLPFAYCPYLLKRGAVRDKFRCRLSSVSDIFFYGGADKDRFRIMRDMKSAGLKVLLAGGYWYKYFPGDSDVIGENLNTAEVETAVKNSKLSLCLVRAANRDEHCMRTYELPFFKACILAQDTRDHRRIYGDTAVEYFKSVSDLTKSANALLSDSDRMKRMKNECHERIVVEGKNTYTDRLKSILGTSGFTV